MVFGDGMVWTDECVKQGDLYVGKRHTGVRASIVCAWQQAFQVG